MSGFPKGACAIGWLLKHATLGHVHVTLTVAAGGFAYEVRGRMDALLASGEVGAGGTRWARDMAIADAVARAGLAQVTA